MHLRIVTQFLAVLSQCVCVCCVCVNYTVFCKIEFSLWNLHEFTLHKQNNGAKCLLTVWFCVFSSSSHSLLYSFPIDRSPFPVLLLQYLFISEYVGHGSNVIMCVNWNEKKKNRNLVTGQYTPTDSTWNSRSIGHAISDTSSIRTIACTTITNAR